MPSPEEDVPGHPLVLGLGDEIIDPWGVYHLYPPIYPLTSTPGYFHCSPRIIGDDYVAPSKEVKYGTLPYVWVPHQGDGGGM